MLVDKNGAKYIEQQHTCSRTVPPVSTICYITTYLHRLVLDGLESKLKVIALLLHDILSLCGAVKSCRCCGMEGYFPLDVSRVSWWLLQRESTGYLATQ